MSLPTGFTVELREDLISGASRQVLIGGSPMTAVALSSRARSMIDGRRITVVDPATSVLARRLLATNLATPALAGMAPVSADDVTVVIPVRDRPHQLARALEGLRGLRCIVVDDASLDAAAIAAVCERHGARYLALPVNVGPAQARNRGLAVVHTPYVALVDSDVRADADALLHLARHFADPAVAVVGPRVNGRPTSAEPRWFERYDRVASSLTLGTVPAVVRAGTAVGWLPSACLVARTEVVRGGFAPEMRVGEDVDLVWRLDQQGEIVRYDPSIVVEHDTRPNISAWLGRKFAYGSSAAPLALRHGDAVAPAVLSPAAAAAGAAILIRGRWSPLIVAAAWGWTTARLRRRLPEGARRTRLAATIAARSLGWAVRQESALALRHWWPATVVLSLFSSRARRVTVTALVADVIVGWNEHSHTAIGPATQIAGRRLDDIAYGAGLWWGCLHHHTAAPLRPRRARP